MTNASNSILFPIYHFTTFLHFYSAINGAQTNVVWIYIRVIVIDALVKYDVSIALIRFCGTSDVVVTFPYDHISKCDNEKRRQVAVLGHKSASRLKLIVITCTDRRLCVCEGLYELDMFHCKWQS